MNPNHDGDSNTTINNAATTTVNIHNIENKKSNASIKSDSTPTPTPSPSSTNLKYNNLNQVAYVLESLALTNQNEFNYQSEKMPSKVPTAILQSIFKRTKNRAKIMDTDKDSNSNNNDNQNSEMNRNVGGEMCTACGANEIDARHVLDGLCNQCATMIMKAIDNSGNNITKTMPKSIREVTNRHGDSFNVIVLQDDDNSELVHQLTKYIQKGDSNNGNNNPNIKIAPPMKMLLNSSMRKSSDNTFDNSNTVRSSMSYTDYNGLEGATAAACGESTCIYRYPSNYNRITSAQSTERNSRQYQQQQQPQQQEQPMSNYMRGCLERCEAKCREREQQIMRCCQQQMEMDERQANCNCQERQEQQQSTCCNQQQQQQQQQKICPNCHKPTKVVCPAAAAAAAASVASCKPKKKVAPRCSCRTCALRQPRTIIHNCGVGESDRLTQLLAKALQIFLKKCMTKCTKKKKPKPKPKCKCNCTEIPSYVWKRLLELSAQECPGASSPSYKSAASSRGSASPGSRLGSTTLANTAVVEAKSYPNSAAVPMRTLSVLVNQSPKSPKSPRSPTRSRYNQNLRGGGNISSVQLKPQYFKKKSNAGDFHLAHYSPGVMPPSLNQLRFVRTAAGTTLLRRPLKFSHLAARLHKQPTHYPSRQNRWR